MKGKIDKNGCLLIERRNGEYIKQICPFKKDFCGDACPLFGEPENGGGYINIRLCQSVAQFKYFGDERKDQNNYEIEFNVDLTQEICKRYWDLQERIEIVENIAKQIDSDEYESQYSKKDEEFAKDSIEIMQRTIKVLKSLEGNIIEFDDNDGE